MAFLSKGKPATGPAQPKTGRDPLRQALADAMAEVRQVDDQIGQAIADRDKGRQLEVACRQRIENAHAAVVAAKASRQSQIVAAVEAGQPIYPDAATREAAAMRDAIEADELYALEIIEAGVARASAIIAEAEDRREKAAEKVKAIASQVLVTNIADIAAEIDRTHKHLVRQIWIMRALARHTLPGPGQFADAYNIVNRFGRLPGGDDQDGGLHRAADPWRAAYEALMTDPDAPLPDVSPAPSNLVEFRRSA